MTEKLTDRNAFLRVCVDTLDEGRAAGRVYSRRLTAPILFSDPGSLLLRIDRLLEEQNFPQASQRGRSFQAEPPADGEGLLPQGSMSKEAVSAASGEKRTFHLYIVTRRNATWQGKVDWLDGSDFASFSSDLELLGLLEGKFSSSI